MDAQPRQPRRLSTHSDVDTYLVVYPALVALSCILAEARHQIRTTKALDVLTVDEPADTAAKIIDLYKQRCGRWRVYHLQRLFFSRTGASAAMSSSPASSRPR